MVPVEIAWKEPPTELASHRKKLEAVAVASCEPPRAVVLVHQREMAVDCKFDVEIDDGCDVVQKIRLEGEKRQPTVGGPVIFYAKQRIVRGAEPVVLIPPPRQNLWVRIQGPGLPNDIPRWHISGKACTCP